MLKSLLVSAAAVAVAAQPRLPPGNKDVSVIGFLADHKDAIIPMNDIGTVVGGLVNNGDLAVNVSGIVGSLWAPDWSTNYYNMSGAFIGEVVYGGDERSLEYRFRVPMVPKPMEAKLLVVVYYENQARAQFAHTLFNQSISISDAKREFNPLEYVPTLLALGLIGASFSFLRGLLLPEKKAGASGGDSGAAGSAADDIDIAASIVAGGAASGKKKEKAAAGSSSGKADSARKTQ